MGTQPSPPRSGSHWLWRRWNNVMMILGILLACAVMAFGCRIIAQSMRSLTDGERRVVRTTDEKAKPPASLQERAFDTYERRVAMAARLQTHDHALTVVSLTFAFALVAVGFSLFVAGIESAYEFSVSGTPKGSLTLASTAPGLACFVLASILVAMTLLRPATQPQLGEFQYRGTAGTATEGNKGITNEWPPP